MTRSRRMVAALVSTFAFAACWAALSAADDTQPADAEACLRKPTSNDYLHLGKMPRWVVECLAALQDCSFASRLYASIPKLGATVRVSREPTGSDPSAS